MVQTPQSEVTIAPDNRRSNEQVACSAVKSFCITYLVRPSLPATPFIAHWGNIMTAKEVSIVGSHH